MRSMPCDDVGVSFRHVICSAEHLRVLFWFARAKDYRGVDLFPFGQLWYDTPDNAIRLRDAQQPLTSCRDPRLPITLATCSKRMNTRAISKNR